MVWTLHLLAFKAAHYTETYSKRHNVTRWLFTLLVRINRFGWISSQLAGWGISLVNSRSQVWIHLRLLFILTELNILIQLFIQNCIFFPLTNLSCILLIHWNIFYNQVNFFNLRNYLYFKIQWATLISKQTIINKIHFLNHE